MPGQPQVSGFNAAGAWKIERGRPDVVVAILDTGIKWDELGLRRQIHLNTGELPLPQTAAPRSSRAPLAATDASTPTATEPSTSTTTPTTRASAARPGAHRHGG